jgi:ATP-binding cassette subfamily B protein
MRHTVRSYLKPYWPSFFLALGQVFLISALELLKPWPLKIIIDNILGNSPLPFGFHLDWSAETLLVLVCTGLVLVYILVGGLRVLNDYTTIRIGQGMVNDLRRDLYSRIQRLSLSFHTRQQVGDLMYRITADTLGIQTLTMNGFFSVLSAVVLLAGMFVVMLSLNLHLTLLALLVCPRAKNRTNS